MNRNFNRVKKIKFAISVDDSKCSNSVFKLLARCPPSKLESTAALLLNVSIDTLCFLAHWNPERPKHSKAATVCKIKARDSAGIFFNFF